MIERYRSQDTNLRTQLLRIIDRAGVDRWERAWHNLRASAEVDLVKQFPLHTAATWLGHSPAVAAKHYLTVTDDDYRKAADEGWWNLCAHQGNRTETKGIQERENLEKNSIQLFRPRLKM